ncbi:MAG: hypothetical protein ACP5OY_04995 [Halothiobacillaceae bacterium]
MKALLHALILLGPAVALAAPQLYETGPAEDAAFVRFVDALPSPVTIRSGKGAAIGLTPSDPSTPWQAVKARTPLRAQLEYNGKQQQVEVTANPGEFVTLAALADGQEGWTIGMGREKAGDFSAHKVALGLMNLTPSCSPASIKLAGKDLGIIEGVAPNTAQRRMINPLSLAVDLYCGTARVAEGVNLGTLRPGERWTLLITPEASKVKLLPVLDRLP